MAASSSLALAHALDLALLATRLAVGLSSAAHGVLKLRGGPQRFAAAFGLPVPLAASVAAAQAVLGLLFALGLFTAAAGLALAGISLAAALMLRVRQHAPFAAPGKAGWDYPLMHAVAPLATAVAGPGAYSLQALL